MQDQGAIGSGFEVAWDVNARGMVVGYRETPQQVVRAVMWQPSTSEVVLEDGPSGTCACNCAGEIVTDALASGDFASDPGGGDVGYLVGAVGMQMPGGYAGSSYGSASGFSSGGGGNSYVGIGRGNAGGFGGVGGGGGGGSFRGTSSSGGGTTEVPEPATVIGWVSGLLIFAGFRFTRRRRATVA